MPRDFLLAHAIVIAFAIVITLPFLSIVLSVTAATAIVAMVASFILGPLLFLLLAAPVVAADSRPAAARWRPPVSAAPTRLFQLGPNPFLRGQHRGVDFATRGAVRAACSGRVVFAAGLPARGR